MRAAIEEYCQSTGQPVPVTAGDFCRCIFRSLALRYRQVLSGIEGMIDFAVRRLHVIGGGSQNQHLMQMTANAIGKTVVSGPVEGTALGNILLQLKAAGQVATLIDMRKVSAASVKLAYYEPQDVAQWDDLYARFVEIQTIRNK
jgi:rhamnulokinase